MTLEQSLQTAGGLEWVQQPESFGAEADLRYGLELLAAAKQGRLGPTMRVYRPAPTVAFGQRDAHLPGFEEAARRCRELGFEPLVRKAGGRAAAYHEGCLILDHVEPLADAIAGAKRRFSQFGEPSPQACATRDCSPPSAKSRGSTAPASSAFTARTRLIRCAGSSW